MVAPSPFRPRSRPPFQRLSPPPRRRFAAWLYTGPLGHLWSSVADVAELWSRWALGRLRERYSKR